MRLKARIQDDGTWLEEELLRRAWTYNDLAAHAGISRMTLYFLRRPGEYGRNRQRRQGTVMPKTARAIVQALVGADGNIEVAMARYFEVLRETPATQGHKAVHTGTKAVRS